MNVSDRTFDKKLGRHIQDLRRKAGFSSAKVFIERTGITAITLSTYAAIEQGSVSCSLDKAIVIADNLGVTLDELADVDGTRAKEEPEAEAAPESEPAEPVSPEELSSRDERDLLRDYRALSAVDRATLAHTAQALCALGHEEDAVRAQVMERLYGIKDMEPVPEGE